MLRKEQQRNLLVRCQVRVRWQYLVNCLAPDLGLIVMRSGEKLKFIRERSKKKKNNNENKN